MEFSEFAKTLRPVIGNSGGAASFVRTLFDAVVKDDCKYVFDGYKDGTFHGYFYGSPGIGEIAKSIYRNLDTEGFAEYIEFCTEGSGSGLADAFSSEIPGITDENAPEKVSELLASIITEAAQCKRGKSMKLDNEEEQESPILEAEATYEKHSQESASAPSPQFTINMIGEHSKVISNCQTVNIYD